MKKWIASLMALLLLVGVLAGCGAKEPASDDKPTKQTEATKAPTQAPTKVPTQAPTQAPTKAPTVKPTAAPTQPIVQPTLPVQTQPIVQPTLPVSGEGAIGTVLNAPEKIYEDSSDTICFSVTMTENGETMTVVYGFDSSADDMFVTYVAVDNMEIIVEIPMGQNGAAVGYAREGKQNAFAIDTEATQEELYEVFEEAFNVLEMLTLTGKTFENSSFKKIVPIVSAVGPVYSYEVTTDGQVTGNISIDKASGMLVLLQATNGDLLTVNAMDLTNARIPAYKQAVQPTQPTLPVVTQPVVQPTLPVQTQPTVQPTQPVQTQPVVQPTQPVVQPTIPPLPALPNITATTYDGILQQAELSGDAMNFAGLTMTNLVTVLDNCINVTYFGSKDGIIMKWGELLYYPISGYTNAEYIALSNSLEEAFKEITDLNCANGGVMGKTNNGKYLIVSITFSDLDDPENYGELYAAGLQDSNSQILLDASVQALVADGAVKK